MKGLLTTIFFIITLLSILFGFMAGIYIAESGHIILGILLMIVCLGGSPFALRFAERRQHIKCGKMCHATGMAGNKFKQFYCKHCEEKFYTLLWWSDGKDH